MRSSAAIWQIPHPSSGRCTLCANIAETSCVTAISEHVGKENHAAGHVFFRLKWLADIARLFDRLGPDEVSGVVRHARSVGCERHVLLSLIVLEQSSSRRFSLLTHDQRRALGGLARRALGGLRARATTPASR